MLYFIQVIVTHEKQRRRSKSSRKTHLKEASIPPVDCLVLLSRDFYC